MVRHLFGWYVSSCSMMTTLISANLKFVPSLYNTPPFVPFVQDIVPIVPFDCSFNSIAGDMFPIRPVLLLVCVFFPELENNVSRVKSCEKFPTSPCLAGITPVDAKHLFLRQFERVTDESPASSGPLASGAFPTVTMSWSGVAHTQHPLHRFPHDRTAV